MTFREFLENNYPSSMVESMLMELPHGNLLGGEVPPEFSFLRGFVDFGFENLGLPENVYKALVRAYSDNGVAIPGTGLKFRYRGGLGVVVEPSNGTEVPLPDHWKQGLYVVSPNNDFTWIGKKVRPDQLGTNVDLSKYYDAGEGWMLK